MRRKQVARCFKSTSLFTSQTEIIQNINIFTSLQICTIFIQVAKLVQKPPTPTIFQHLSPITLYFPLFHKNIANFKK